MKQVLVVAHPDDEIIFFSSVVEKVDKIIICFGPSKTDVVSKGRLKVQEQFLLSNVTWLNLKEASVYNSANWDHPEIVEYGIKVNRNNEIYKQNFDQLCTIFKKTLEPYDVIYTHNPWGEYGHEEHVSVFKAVIHSTSKIHAQKIFVSSYLSDKSQKLFLKQKHLLGDDMQRGSIPKSLCTSLKKLYTKFNCWTWDNDYQWPNSEIFLQVNMTYISDPLKRNISTTNPPTMLITIPNKHSFIRNLIFKIISCSKKMLKYILRIR